MKDTTIKHIKPLLRWAGGKSWITKSLERYLPTHFNNYYEPFLGGASIALFLKQREVLQNEVLLSDSNENLINFYECIRDYPNEILSELNRYENNKEEYYIERAYEYKDPIKKAAQFYYLNRTSFNGIYRENLKGEYNVPYGFKTYSTLFDSERIKRFSNLIQKMSFRVQDFYDIRQEIVAGDFVFLDPPYTVAHENNGFVKYNQKIFTWNDQERLKELAESINNIGAYFILTNAHHQSILDLYDGFGQQIALERASVIGGKKAKRAIYKEILITNLNL